MSAAPWKVYLLLLVCGHMFVTATEGRLVRKTRSLENQDHDDDSEDTENEVEYTFGNNTGDGDTESEGEEDMFAREAGAIVGVIFGGLFALVLVSVAGFLYIRRRRQRTLEYSRANKTALSSARNAGVYRETTTDEKLQTVGNPAYKSLVPRSDLYENESDEELFFR